MINKRYIDIDSTYRDRTLYPNPAYFAVENLNNNITTDPVSNASMVYPTPTYFNTYAYPISLLNNNVLQIEGVYDIDDNVYPINIPLTQTNNIFINKTLEIINDDPEVNSGNLTTTYSNINQVIYNNSTTFLLETNSVYTDIDTNTISSNPPNNLLSFYLSPTSSDIDNYYVNKTIKINNQTRNIIYYDGGRRMVTLNNALTSPPTTGDIFEIYASEVWNLITDEPIITTPSLTYPSHLIHNYPTFTRNLYRIRDGIPVFTGNVDIGNNSILSVQLPSNASDIDDYYKDNWIWFNNQNRLVYTGQVDNPITANQTRWQISDLFITPSSSILSSGMQVIIKTSWSGTDYLIVSEIDTIISNNQFTILYGFPEPVKLGDTIWIYEPNPILNQYRLITSYNGTSKVATLNTPLPSSVVSNDTFDILKVNYDNYNKLNIVQSNVNTNQPVCYELELQCLTLPNLILDSGYGNRIAFYPYVYIEFSSLTSKTYQNALQTNVPDINNVIFKVPVYAVNTPSSSTFVVLDGRGMVHTLKFKSNDSFLVKVLLPNGEIFKTEQQDSIPPITPLPQVQISLTLSVRRLI